MDSFLTFHPEKNLSLFFPVIRELRPHLDEKSFLDLYEKARASDQYSIIGLMRNDELLGAMGYRILHDFVHGRHLYVDDLVTTENARSQGIGAILLKKAEALAIELNCSNLRLCTGIANEGGKRFYTKNGWDIRSVAFKKKLN